MLQKLLNVKTFYYITTLFIAVLVGLVGGVVDILQTDAVVEASQTLGYPLYFFFLLGVFKILGAIALLLPKSLDRIKDLAYFGFAVDFIFASFSHFSVGDPMAKIITPLIMFVILGVSYALKNKI
jgi:uncharacterized membrane protein